MKLKDHPSMIDKSHLMESPGAFYDKGNGRQQIKSENEVIIIQASYRGNDLYLDYGFDEGEGQSTIPIDDEIFLKNIVRIFNENKGKSLEEVRNMEVDF